MKNLLIFMCLVFSTQLFAQKNIIIRNVNVFDGKNEQLKIGVDVLIQENIIQKIAKDIAIDSCEVIDGQGKTLIPGLTDSHTHIMWNDNIEYLVYGAPEGYSGVLAAVNAREMLMRGFTTIRDVGGPSFGLKQLIDDGVTPGPRILPSGAFLSQTSGHGDYDPKEWYLSPHFTGQIDKAYLRGWTIIADGVAETQKATRDILRGGAAQIKAFGSGSITGAHDPIDVTEYTIEELETIVKETDKWGTYATIHAYSNEGVQNAINAGFQCVEHGLFATEETFQMMKGHDVFLSTQFLAFGLTPKQAGLEDEAAKKYLIAQASAEEGYKRAKKIGVKMSWGTDALGSLDIQRMQSLEFKARAKYFTGYEILLQATSYNAELFERSGERHPYKEAKLGVVEQGAYADLLIVDGNPLEDITLLSEPENNLLFIMKDGKIFKNILP
ncbi:amidohydrolase family protein [Flammeovirga sp. SubArs3]|uniref:metal-dependent hydrolase family protein n=1 Tax=Flammeovirga sp. SubArs3 TaxID=2995316 RepID=UPI00248B3497|nr:amidohydrolase family protein [Flammeovirga sp. SubArs3]